jgi:N6-L-threonylcarbamoyladenine synthase
MKKDVLILAIETSCDETAASVVKNGRQVLSNVILSQSIHSLFGGVVPELAGRSHVLNIDGVVRRALDEAGVGVREVDAIAVTSGAGLVGALLVGVSFAKALSFALNIPLVEVNHIRAHIAANFIDTKLEPPFISLVVSGGHTAIVKVNDYFNFETLGATVDDAAGEAFDKVARVLGLQYPGGEKIDKLSKGGKNNISFMRQKKWEGFDFSYSGLKTAVINYIHKLQQSGEKLVIEDICRSFTCAALDPLIEKSIRAAKQNNLSIIALAGGVAANSYLRQNIEAEAAKSNITVMLPKQIFCTDNAAMVGAQGYYNYINGVGTADLKLNAKPSQRI